jgi:transposase
MSIVGIDIASKSANYAVLGSRGFISTNNEFTMDSRGFEAFMSSRDVAEDDVFVMESTGNYHLPLYSWLLNHGRKALIINPMLIKQHQKGITIRRTKTDRLDAMAIARYAADPSARLPQGERSMDTESKVFARRREQNAEELAKAKTILKGDLSVAFPELLVLGVFTKSMLGFLCRFGSARDVLQASDAELENALYVARGRHSQKINAKTIRELADKSIGVASHGALVKDSARKVLECTTRDEELTKALLDLETSIHKDAVEIVASMPGIGLVTASQFMAEVEDISRFETYQKLIAYMGTDPGIYQSGESERHGHITKRGNASLRKYVFLMAQGSLKWNPVFNAYYHKKRDSGFPHRKAMVATMNKLIRTIFILLTRGEKYCEEKV